MLGGKDYSLTVKELSELESDVIDEKIDYPDDIFFEKDYEEEQEDRYEDTG